MKGGTRAQGEKVSVFSLPDNDVNDSFPTSVEHESTAFERDVRRRVSNVGREARRTLGWNRTDRGQEVGAGVAHSHLRSPGPWAFALSTGSEGGRGREPEETELDARGMGRPAWAGAPQLVGSAWEDPRAVFGLPASPDPRWRSVGRRASRSPGCSVAAQSVAVSHRFPETSTTFANLMLLSCSFEN